MRRMAEIAGAVFVILSLTGTAAGQFSQSEFERLKREVKERHERLVAEAEARHQHRHSKLYDEYKRAAAEQKRRWEERRKPLPFDVDLAPSPGDCLKSYIAAATAATSYEELYKFLPRNELPTPSRARSEQVRASSQAAADEYARFALKRHKRIAKKILEVLRVKIDGNKAVVIVSTTSGGISNGVHYPYGKATIEMLGEHRYWKIDSYNDSLVKYLHPPQPKR